LHRRLDREQASRADILGIWDYSLSQSERVSAGSRGTEPESLCGRCAGLGGFLPGVLPHRPARHRWWPGRPGPALAPFRASRRAGRVPDGGGAADTAAGSGHRRAEPVRAEPGPFDLSTAPPRNSSRRHGASPAP